MFAVPLCVELNDWNSMTKKQLAVFRQFLPHQSQEPEISLSQPWPGPSSSQSRRAGQRASVAASAHSHQGQGTGHCTQPPRARADLRMISAAMMARKKQSWRLWLQGVQVMPPQGWNRDTRSRPKPSEVFSNSPLVFQEAVVLGRVSAQPLLNTVTGEWHPKIVQAKFEWMEDTTSLKQARRSLLSDNQSSMVSWQRVV